MRVTQPDTRSVLFDCPWTGHVYDGSLIVRNASAPHVIGVQCVKCGGLIYLRREESPIVGVDGAPLPKVEAKEDSDDAA